MEQLRKNAAGLAIWNTVVPVAALILGILSASLFLKGSRNGITWFVIFLVLTDVPLFVFYFTHWFQFLGSLKTCYEGNDTIRNAVRVGNIATALKIGCFTLGIISSLIIVISSGGYRGTINASEVGLIPTGNIQSIIHSIMMAILVLMSIMFLLLREQTEKKSEMRIIPILLIVFMLIYSTAAISDVKSFWGMSQIVILLLEFLFFWKISKGFVFSEPKK